MEIKNVKELLDTTEVFLLDMDGTIYLESTPIGDMINTLKKLRKIGKKIVYFTNNSSKTKCEYIEKLTRIGFWEKEDYIYTSGMAGIWYLNKYYKDKKVYLLGTDALKEQYREKGINIVNDNPEVCLLAFDTSMTYQKIRMFNEFLVQGKPYIATHPDIVCPTANISMPDLGSFFKLFELSSGRLPDAILGKPFEYMGEMVKEDLNMPKEKIAMVGDRLNTDIRFGNNCGFKSVLVLSGETKREMLESSSDKPSIVLNTLNDVAEYI